MPIPSIQVNCIEDAEDGNIHNKKPSIPILRVVSDDVDGLPNEVNSDDDDDDVMTAEEEAALERRFLSGSDQTEQRRMSSLDMYLSQPEVKQESMIINRHLSLKEEEKDFEAEQKLLCQKEREEMEKHQEKLRLEREEVKKARASKKNSKVTEEQELNRNNQVRRVIYRKQGLGGLSKERRRKLKEMILQKAKNELLEERRKELRNREDHIKKCAPPFDIDGLNQAQLEEKVKSWYEHVKELESQKYEWEQRLRKQDEEIYDLTAQLCSIKGHFQKPILRKVAKPMSTDRLRAMSAAPNFAGKTGHKNFVEMKRKLSDTNQVVASNLNGTGEVCAKS
ncbi:Troponin I [Schistosoma japonicum]|uniref:Troponin I n=2 Tax=Schistosoma japonicum TaxID=6182 RepID=A0A4Z2DM18_SCHJA|nr:Troponin I [Schistosoma japonicum]KAH8871867.1 Troponin I [Schistosoma japonicum]KAH8871869.1 Troponin I [Schistosoma japonicum]KAH8871870.1 Troponin I [Schistosoma japonicum]TNN17509.1 Troponin I [Schistosoma japonicum]